MTILERIMNLGLKIHINQEPQKEKKYLEKI